MSDDETLTWISFALCAIFAIGLFAVGGFIFQSHYHAYAAHTGTQGPNLLGGPIVLAWVFSAMFGVSAVGLGMKIHNDYGCPAM